MKVLLVSSSVSILSLLLLALSAKCSVAHKHDESSADPSIVAVASSTSSFSSISSEHHPHEDRPKEEEEENAVAAAAQRLLLQATSASSASSGGGDAASPLLDDLKLVLSELWDETEVRSMIHKATTTATTQQQQPANATNSDTSPRVGNSGDREEACPAGEKVTNDDSDDDDEEYEDDEEEPTDMFSADRHVRGILNVHKNPDCLTLELDASNPDAVDVDHAREVLDTCRVLVLRNLFSSNDEVVNQMIPRFLQYTNNVTEGHISNEGTTTYGGDYFILNEDEGRVNYMLPKEVALGGENDNNRNNAALFANDLVLEILSHPSILDEDLTINHMGTLNAWPGAPAQGWHADARPLFGTDAGHEWGVAGHDVPPYAITLFTPLLLPNQNMTYQLGPTEFCLGTSHLQGWSHPAQYPLPVRDPTLLHSKEESAAVQQLVDFDRFKDSGGVVKCPDGFGRVPLLQRGDALLFDYMVVHRGGANRHPTDIRSMLFVVYSRKWYRDSTFDTPKYYSSDDDEEEGEEDVLERLTQLTRFAVVERG